jgi:hypothetical protein
VGTGDTAGMADIASDIGIAFMALLAAAIFAAMWWAAARPH